MAIPPDTDTTTHPFDRYGSEDVIWYMADAVSANAGQVDILGGEVTAAHRPAREGVAGLLEEPMVANERPVAREVQAWTQSALFGGNAVRLFGNAVEVYNNGVADLNRRYWAAKHAEFGIARVHLPPSAVAADWDKARAERRSEVAAADSRLMAQLNTERDGLQDTLDGQAATVAGLLDRGPEDASAVLDLYRAGGLPIGTLWLFPGVAFDSVPPPLTGRDGQAAAELVRRALDGKASGAEFRQAMFMLDLIGDHALYVQRHGGGGLTEGEVSFLTQFYDGVGDRLWELPDYIADDHHHWSSDRQHNMLGDLGAGLLALSNPALWSPTIRDRSHYHLPETVSRLVFTSDTGVPMNPRNGGALFAGQHYPELAQMLVAANAEMQGGKEFSAHLTLTVSDMPAFGSFVRTDKDVMLQLLGVSLRNADANYGLLTGEYQSGQYGDATTRFMLEHLYTTDWPDNGQTVAKLTDWIPEYAHGDQHQREMAASAADHLIAQIANATGGEFDGYGTRYPDNHAPGDHYRGLFNALIDIHDGDERPSFGELNPAIVRSLYLVGNAYLDAFGTPSGETIMDLHDPTMFHVGEGDAARYFQLIAGDEASAKAMSASIQNWAHIKAAQFVNSGEAVNNGSEVGYVLSFYEAGLVNDVMDRKTDFANAEAAVEARHEFVMSLVTGPGETFIGGLPLGGKTVNEATGVEYGKQFLDLALAQGKPGGPPEPAFTPNLPPDQQHVQLNSTYLTTRYVAQAASASGRVPAAELAPLLPPLDQVPRYDAKNQEQGLTNLLIKYGIDPGSFSANFNSAYGEGVRDTMASSTTEYRETIERGHTKNPESAR